MRHLEMLVWRLIKVGTLESIWLSCKLHFGQLRLLAADKKIKDLWPTTGRCYRKANVIPKEQSAEEENAISQAGQ